MDSEGFPDLDLGQCLVPPLQWRRLVDKRDRTSKGPIRGNARRSRRLVWRRERRRCMPRPSRRVRRSLFRGVGTFRVVFANVVEMRRDVVAKNVVLWEGGVVEAIVLTSYGKLERPALNDVGAFYCFVVLLLEQNLSEEKEEMITSRENGVDVSLSPECPSERNVSIFMKVKC